MADIKNMSPAALREAAEAILAAREPARAAFRQFVDPKPRRMKVEDRERAAYLRGVLAGIFQAGRELEKRAPVNFQETE